MDKSLLKVMAVPSIMLGITAVSGFIATIPSTSAEESISPVDDTVTITVDSSCTMGQTVESAHSTQLNPGETNSTIGQSRIAAYCNDTDGYAIYAIGYTNGEYGNTSLVSTNGNTIATGVDGSGSYWNMKLTPASSGDYIPNIVSPFTTNTAIPNDYTKVAYRDSITPGQTVDPTTSGSYFTTTYQAHVSTTQPAGVYNGQVQYVMVHPSGAAAPEKPPTMQETAKIKAKLVNEGDTMQAIDSRDGKKYWITKLADGNIWMTQNLDFDIVAGKTYTSADTDLANSTIGTSWTPTASTSTTSSWTSSTTAPSSYNPGDLYWNGTVTTSGGTLSTNTVSDPSATTGGTHYHVGNYYNWTAAVAMNDSSSYTTQYTDVNQSICPAGWMLPKSGTTLTGSGSFQYLVNRAGLKAGTEGNIQNSPTYFVYGGYWNGSSGSVGYGGNGWSSVVGNSSGAYLLGFNANGSLYPQGGGSRGTGYSIRCVAR